MEFNLKGVDLENNYSVFDLTGSEFSNGFIADLGTLHPEPGVEQQFGNKNNHQQGPHAGVLQVRGL